MKYKNDKSKKADWMVHGNRTKTKKQDSQLVEPDSCKGTTMPTTSTSVQKNGQVVDQIHFLENSNSDYDRHMFLMLQ